MRFAAAMFSLGALVGGRVVYLYLTGAMTSLIPVGFTVGYLAFVRVFAKRKRVTPPVALGSVVKPITARDLAKPYHPDTRPAQPAYGTREWSR